MTEWLNVLADMIQKYMWVAPIPGVAGGGSDVAYALLPLSSVPMVIADRGFCKKGYKKSISTVPYHGGRAGDYFSCFWFCRISGGTLYA